MICFVGGSFAHQVAATQDGIFPYQMVVGKRTADIHSGPGAVHYRTDRLSSGKVVEVYREDPDGWLAIRPPLGSFSLIRAGEVAATDEPGIARVISDDVKAWVGTRLQSPTTPLWQIKLRRDELVEVIGDQYVKDADGNREKWLRIAPPAGEFRWIRESSVEAMFPRDVSSHEGDSASVKPNTSTDELIAETDDQQSSDSRQVSATADLEEGSQSETPARLPSGLTGKPIEPASVSVARPADGWEASKERDDHQGMNRSKSAALDGEDSFSSNASTETEREDDETLSNQAADDSVAENKSQSETLANDESEVPPAAAVRELEIALTRMMTLPIEMWNPAPLRQALTTWQQEMSDPQAQSDFAKIASKLDECEELQRKLLAMNAAAQQGQGIREILDNATSSTDSNSNALSEEREMTDGELARNALGEEQFDESKFAGVGYLNRLYTDRGQGPAAYVLQDKTGRILRVVTPAPGVNLERYLEKEVALVGQAVKHPRFNRPLIIADRVVLPSRHTR